MNRRPDWERILDLAIEHARSQPFSWSHRNCAIWCADVVHAMTGHDPGATWRNLPDNAWNVRMAVARAGGLARIATDALGPSSPIAMARRGDVVLLAGDGALGICVGRRVAVPGPKGLAFASLEAGEMCWRVG
ncbi:MAG: hypothetical protein VYB54_07470 [Pseudomonadota bacterium]|nr:hypothetical protein [Pseudomonadota bacterium]